MNSTLSLLLKPNKMKRTIIFSLMAALVFMIASCSSSSPESKLIGTWKSYDVQTDFDEDMVSPEMLSQMVEVQEKTYFRIINDTILIIISEDNTYETEWMLDHETNTLSYFFSGNESKANVLGVVKGDEIVSESVRPFGKMSVSYRKE